ncbi:uncharacterized protein LOC116258428 [Nymphaea colorata]|uniref:Amine oxidase domain-containing protein n=1 Tax=Nymphaea colorata TaxID=210225 RepID=A0A5K1FWN6_9MAGN|nr:uncharacterized protein LOC116258428 [Nymphaea colorata]
MNFVLFPSSPAAAITNSAVSASFYVCPNVSFGPPLLKFSRRISCPLIGASAESQDSLPELVTETGVIVIGAGLSGLSAAAHLSARKIPFLLLEASDAVGGRVRTDKVDGFLLDRGFQIFITAYPEAKRMLDYEALDLQKFYSGALVYFNGEFHRVADPFRHFGDSLTTVANPIGNLTDKLLVGLNRITASRASDQEIFSAPEVTISETLKSIGFSDSIIDRFFRPFFGGVFFDKDLVTSSRLYDFIFKCLALGDNTLPANGIAAIPDQLSSKLPPDSVWFGAKVAKIDFPAGIVLEDGRTVKSQHGVILAVEEPEAVRLLEGRKPASKPGRSTVCLYFSADDAPIKEPILILNGSGEGLVNNMFFATNVAKSYGPAGKTLVSATLVGGYDQYQDEELEEMVRKELGGWFGSSTVGSWKHLRTYRIGFAQPDQRPPIGSRFKYRDPRVGAEIYICGDHVESATFDGALVSGRRAAEALIADKGL